jgi:signal peptidase I
MKRRKRWIWLATAGLALACITPSYVRAYRVAGASDAPTYLTGDLALAYKAAYDVRLPYTGLVLLSHSDPERGDVVLFRVSGSGYPVFKRVLGVPGDTIRILGNHVILNGTPLAYEPAAAPVEAEIVSRNRLGSVIEWESGAGPAHLISWTPGAKSGEPFGPVTVPEGRYFVMGDNRWSSLDSRDYGSIPRSEILGRLGGPFRGLR